MEKLIAIDNEAYMIPAIFSYAEKSERMPAIILCHGTGSQKNEVGNLFVEMSKRLLNIGIASIRLDYAGCGDSKACQTELNFCGEVNDTKKVYQYLCAQDFIDCSSIGILGFSQGARVMAELLKDMPSIRLAISWSGACHNGMGVFKGWFDEYYQEASERGYARIPLFWREDLLLSKKWFDDIRDTTPMAGVQMYEGPVLAVAGDKDELVPYYHAKEIVENSRNNNSKAVIVQSSNHTFNVLMPDDSKADDVIEITIQWIKKILMMDRKSDLQIQVCRT